MWLVETLAVFNRWIALAATAVLVGALVLELMVLLPASEWAAVKGRLRSWALGGWALLVVSTGAELLIRSHRMSAGSASTAVAAVPAVLAYTHFGTIWIGRFGALAVIPVAMRSSRRAGAFVALAASLAVALTSSVTGHAGDWGGGSVAVGLDWLHSVAAAGWTGGLLVLTLVVFRNRPPLPPAILLPSIQRFSKVAGWCLLVVVATGLSHAWIQVGAPSRLGTTTYGRLLVAKLACLAALAWLGAINRFRIIPVLARVARVGREAQGAGGFPTLGEQERAPNAAPAAWSRLSANITGEVVLALLVLACTALLGGTTPARHAGHGSEHGGIHPPEARSPAGARGASAGTEP
jgi:putative copper export protein